VDRPRPRDPIRVRVTDPTPIPHLRVSIFPILSEAPLLYIKLYSLHIATSGMIAVVRAVDRVSLCLNVRRVSPLRCARGSRSALVECSDGTPMGDPFRDLSQEDPFHSSLQSFGSDQPTSRFAVGPLQGSSQFITERDPARRADRSSTSSASLAALSRISGQRQRAARPEQLRVGISIPVWLRADARPTGRKRRPSRST
jgi:hypothetical protein